MSPSVPEAALDMQGGSVVAEQLKIVSAAGKTIETKRLTPIEAIKTRQTKELVIAFCGPAGCGNSTVASELEDVLKEEFGYQVVRKRVSDFITKNAGKIRQIFTEGQFKNSYEKISTLQAWGNDLRKEYKNDILAQLIIRSIAVDRQKRGEEDARDDEHEVKRKTFRVAYLIDSLKHPEEVNLLRALYGNMFYLFGVLCPYTIRNKRLQEKGMKPHEASKIIETDKQEEEVYGQKLLKTLQYADFFIRNSHMTLEPLSAQLKRFIHLILGTDVVTPTVDEYAMYVAQSVALKSACMSRQVGAVIVSKNGDIIATGCNDVPKFNGGLYSFNDGSGDMRCAKRVGERCMNDFHKQQIEKHIERLLVESKLIASDQGKVLAHELVSKTRISDLIEFSRAVHAEMDALVTAARDSTESTKGATLYTTTFPCHNCARHIIAAGIHKVFYIEPYEKSLAIELHDDAIALDTDSTADKVQFLHFEGVAPRQYQNLFKPREARKRDGKLVKVEPETAMPVVPQYLDTFFDFESKVIDHLSGIGFD